MTDEEKAKKYCEEEKWCIGCSYPLNCKEVSCFHKEDYKCGYLDGFTEGRKEKWHKLEENPDDLPTTEDLHNFSKYVLCALKFNDFVFYQVMNIHYPSKTWIVVDNNKNYSDKNVIAWCEFPKFKE